MTEDVGRPVADRTRRTPQLLVAVILAIGVAAAAGLFVGFRLTAGPPSTPGDASIDAGFARDMQAHHAQAVQMSNLVLERTQDQEVRTLAWDVLLTQQQQAGQMYGWLEQWNLPQSSSRPAMSWMPDAAGGMAGMQPGQTAPSEGMGSSAMMPGMATPQDLQRLRQASGEEAERLYLQLMIPHHQGGVQMAQVAAKQASDPDVRRLAQAIVDSQTAELTVLRQMLAARGGPVPAP